MCLFDAAGARVCPHHCPPHFNQTFYLVYNFFLSTQVAGKNQAVKHLLKNKKQIEEQQITRNTAWKAILPAVCCRVTATQKISRVSQPRVEPRIF